MSSEVPEVLRDRLFTARSLRGSRFMGCDLGDVVVRGSDVAGMEIDSPWLLEGPHTLLVNGVDVVPLVDAELDRRFPGRALRVADDPDGLRAAWEVLERTWSGALDRVTRMPEGSVDVSVDGEWSFAQTLRHLVHATDTWLGKAILGSAQPFHEVGLPDEPDRDGNHEDVFVSEPSFDEVLRARADRQTMVREYLAHVTPDLLTHERRNPHAAEYQETVLTCLRTILEEEWEHHRYATRDLDVLAARLTCTD